MIEALQGKVISIVDDGLILDVSGFGVKVQTTASLIRSVSSGDELFCYTYLQVSSMGISMFGFLSERERDLFLELVKVKTVGGKLAITILQHLDAEDILRAISLGDTSALTVPGLGAKRVERICFELKPKIEKKFPEIEAINKENNIKQTVFSVEKAVLEALTGLGFTMSESMKAISLTKSIKEENRDISEEELLKDSLSLLQRK